MKDGRDFLGGFGPDHNSPQRAPATSGGVKEAKDIGGYRPPQGPIGIDNPKGPGLHGDNHGISNGCTPGRGSGSVGLHGDNRGKSGSQR